MKNILLATLLLITIGTSAQTVSGIPLKDIDVEYIEMTVSDKLFSSKLSVSIDLGQPTKALGGTSETYIKDDNGKTMEFNSIAHALNFMTSYGYKLEETYTVQVRDNLEVVHYVMRK